MMPSSAVRAFTDPDDYAAAIRATNTELTVTGRGQFTGKLIRIDLHRMWMQRARDNLPRIAHSTNIAGRAVISFRTRPGPNLRTAALEMQPTNIVCHSEGQSYYRRSSGLAAYASISLPVADMISFGAALAGVDLIPPKDPLIHTPPPAAMTKLQRLHAAAGHLAENAPEIIANPDAARGLEQAMIEALIGCLGSHNGRESSLAQGQHAIVMHRFHQVVDEHPEQPLYIPEICTAIGVSQRTLRMCCDEHLGMAPKRYLLRRMHLVRRALHEAAADTASVTDVATRYGFWHLGRFAVEYCSVFGESPSATLRRRSD
jgi:AraC-like DNA-binding protein